MKTSRHPRNVLIGLLTVLVTLGVVGRASAQNPSAAQTVAPAVAVAAPGELQELVLRDGTRAIGRVEKVDNGRVTFRTESGATLEVAIAQVMSAEVVHGQVVSGSYWPEDSNPTRLFFAPTGRTLKRGDAYFGLYEIYMPFVQYGVTDRFSIGGGTLLFVGGGAHPVWFTPKLQLVSAPTTQASIGVMHFLNIDNASLGVAYAAVTKGTTDSAATVGLGWAYARSDGHNGGSAVLMVGGEHRLSRRVKFVTENYFFDGHGLLSGGVRMMGERLSADVGLFTPLDADTFIALPMVNFVWKFAK